MHEVSVTPNRSLLQRSEDVTSRPSGARPGYFSGGTSSSDRVAFLSMSPSLGLRPHLLVPPVFEQPPPPPPPPD